MQDSKREVILYFAVSLDGYIAKENGDIDWLSMVEREGEDYGYKSFFETVDTVIIGRKTYDKVLEMGVEKPYPGKKLYVLSRSKQGTENGTEYYQGNVKELVASIRAKEGKRIYCDGGAETIRQFVGNDLVDRYVFSFIPVLLGDGIRLFQQGLPYHLLQHISTKSFPSGLVQVEYERNRKGQNE